MAPPPRRLPYSAPHSLTASEERAVHHFERLHIGTIDALLEGLRSIAPQEFSEAQADNEGQACTDREERIKVLEERARLGVGLFHAGDTVHLPPEAQHAGRHHRKRRRRPT